MENKAYDLLTKMYGELTEFKKDITQKVQENSNQILRLEHDIKALYDGYSQVCEKLSQLEAKVDDISLDDEKQAAKDKKA